VAFQKLRFARTTILGFWGLAECRVAGRRLVYRMRRKTHWLGLQMKSYRSYSIKVFVTLPLKPLTVFGRTVSSLAGKAQVAEPVDQPERSRTDSGKKMPSLAQPWVPKKVARRISWMTFMSYEESHEPC
jgi:hypothetical protein